MSMKDWQRSLLDLVNILVTFLLHGRIKLDGCPRPLFHLSNQAVVFISKRSLLSKLVALGHWDGPYAGNYPAVS